MVATGRGLEEKIWWQHHLEKKAEKKAKWGKGGWKDQDEEEEDEKDEAPPGVDADHEPLGKKDGHDDDHHDGPGEAPGLPPAIMVNEIRAKDEAGSLWTRVEVCTEAWAVCACMPACIYSSSFLMSSQDSNSGGKAEAPVFFHALAWC